MRFLPVKLLYFFCYLIKFTQLNQMEFILQRLQQTLSWKELMRSSCRRNGLNTSYAGELTILKLKQLSQRFRRSHQCLKEKLTNIWIENELKAYNWILIAVSLLDDVAIEQFGQLQWNTLQKLFPSKTQIFLKFQARKLINGRKKKNKNWSVEENDLLKQIVIKSGDTQPQWNQTARQLFELSQQKFFRTGKHCRERWLNHLDPLKQRGLWTPDDDLFLLDSVQKSGKKWSEFAVNLKRTEHMVKNRFNSLLIKQKRLTPHFKKQEKLISQIRKRISLGSEHDDQQQEQQQEQVIIQKTVGQQQVQLPLKIQSEPEINEGIKITNKQNGVDHQEISAFVRIDGIQQYVREDLELKNLKGPEFTQMYSPFWSYSPNNPTPTNFMASSPSPLSFYMGFNFANCFSRFTNQINSLSSVTSTNIGTSSKEQCSDIN